MRENELDRHVAGKVTQFNDSDSGESTCERVVDVELVDWADGEVELAFDTFSPKRRTYIRIRLDDMKRLLRNVK